jgi:hypothetical protein
MGTAIPAADGRHFPPLSTAVSGARRLVPRLQKEAGSVVAAGHCEKVSRLMYEPGESERASELSMQASNSGCRTQGGSAGFIPYQSQCY